MTLRLILIRHTKSSWNAPLEDHARPLNRRGRESATAIGHWLAEKGHRPDEVLCSDAMRTRETLAHLLDTWGEKPQVAYLPALYHAAPETILAEIRKASGQTLAVIGHNPGIAFAAATLAERAPAHDRFHDYPTGATLVLEFDLTDWTGLNENAGQVIDFTVPRDLV